jgi:tetratricopeptide (TPR) repeat protein
MRSRFTLGIIGGMLLTLLTPNSLKAQAKGDLGASRPPQTCPSRLEPRTGVISAAQAIKYATCEAEADRRVKSPGQTNFIDISSLEVNPKPRQAKYLDINYFGKAIANSPVYDIRGTAVAYSCAAINNRAGGGRPGKNCLNTHADDRGPNNSVGVCFREPSGNWRCRLSVGSGKGLQYGPPPDSATALGSSETQIDPNDNGKAYFEQARIKNQKKDYQGAITDLNRAIQINPNNADFHEYRASVKREQKNYQGALADFNRAIQINPNNPTFYADRGNLKFHNLKNRSGAIKDWQQAAKLFRQQGDIRGYEFMLDVIKEVKNH